MISHLQILGESGSWYWMTAEFSISFLEEIHGVNGPETYSGRMPLSYLSQFDNGANGFWGDLDLLGWKVFGWSP